MKLLAHVLPLLSAWARAQAPIAAPLNISWDPWTNFTGFSDARVLTGSGTCGYSKRYFPRRASGPSGGNGTATERAGAQGQAMGWVLAGKLAGLSEPQKHHGRPD